MSFYRSEREKNLLKHVKFSVLFSILLTQKRAQFRKINANGLAFKLISKALFTTVQQHFRVQILAKTT